MSSLKLTSPAHPSLQGSRAGNASQQQPVQAPAVISVLCTPVLAGSLSNADELADKDAAVLGSLPSRHPRQKLDFLQPGATQVRVLIHGLRLIVWCANGAYHVKQSAGCPEPCNEYWRRSRCQQARPAFPLY